MEGSAPKEVIHYKDQEESVMRQKVAPEVTQMTGHSVNPESLKPIDDTPLHQIEENLEEFRKDMGNLFSTLGQEASGGATYIRETEGEIGSEIAKGKQGKIRRFLKNFGLKKAA